MRVILKCGETIEITESESITLVDAMMDCQSDNQFIAFAKEDYSELIRLNDISAIKK